MSNVHTGLVGTGNGPGRAMTIRQVSQVLWEIRFADTDQVFSGRTLSAALTKAIEYRRDTKTVIGDNARVMTAAMLEHLLGVRR